MSSLEKQTVSSVKWLVGSSFLQKAIQLCGTIILARILGPADFGLFALAFVAIDTLGLFKSMGFDSAIIQRKEEMEKAANTAFFVIPLLGIALYLILAISAPLIARFFNNQQLVGIIRALGIIFVISCFGRVPAALMEKYMLFKQVSIIEISSAVVYTTSAVILAFLKFGAWSLVYAYILKTMTQNILTFIYAKWLPRFDFDKKIALEMFHFGKFMFLSGVVWFLKMNLDNILVGKILGVTALGLYAIAFNIANFGADYFGSKVYRVIFPVFSKIQDDKDALRKAFLKTTKLMSIFAFPLCAVLFLLSNELVSLVYGTKWVNSIPILKVLAFVGLFNTLPIAMGPLFNATGKAKVGFYFVIFQVSLFLLFITPAAKLYGLIGVGVVVTLSQLIPVLVALPFTKKIISIKISELVACLRPGFLGSIAISVIILAYKYSFIPKFQNLDIAMYINFCILAGITFLSYIFSLFILDKPILHEIKGMFVKTGGL